jgi:hypothetical protein
VLEGASAAFEAIGSVECQGDGEDVRAVGADWDVLESYDHLGTERGRTKKHFGGGLVASRERRTWVIEIEDDSFFRQDCAARLRLLSALWFVFVTLL